MTDTDIIFKAIEKAIKNGCSHNTFNIDTDLWMQKKLYYSVIFAHDFAKAFWHCDHKLKPYESGSFIDECETCGECRMIGEEFASWKNHLQQMMLEEEPLKYIEKFL